MTASGACVVLFWTILYALDALGMPVGRAWGWSAWLVAWAWNLADLALSWLSCVLFTIGLLICRSSIEDIR